MRGKQAPVAAPSVRPRGLRRGLRHFTKLIAALAEAPVPGRGNWLFARDARAKVIACLLLAVTATLLSSVAALIWSFGAGLLLLLSTGSSMRRYLSFAGPPLLFTMLMAAPAGLNLVTPGRIWISICNLPAGHWGIWNLPPELAVTDHGVVVAGRLVVRVLAAMTAAYVLVSTTRADRLWSGLRGLGAPAIVVMLLSMMHRYLDLLARVGAEMHLARLSRSVGHLPPREDRQWFAAGVATLFRRAQSLAEGVHGAMWSRGYTGEVRLLQTSTWRWPDTLLVGGMTAVCALLLRLP